VTEPLPFVGKPALLSSTVGEALERRILSGEWVAGQRVPSEPELSQQLGVSRSVIRDAVRSLVARGLLDVRQGFGTTVSAPTDDTYTDALTLMLTRSDLTVGDLALAREALDLQLAEVAAVRHEEADLVALELQVEKLEAAAKAGDWPAAEAPHLAFHLGILDATRLPALMILLRPLQRLILATSIPVRAEDPATWPVEYEIAVLDAIRERDPILAREAMAAHYWFIRDPIYASRHALPLSEVLAHE
jgi:GntR family transcriptional regulator, transcriptional repressor for pyruvate dehydrogenase complex